MTTQPTVVLLGQQVNMNNFTDPIQKKYNIIKTQPGNDYRISLVANEFEDFKDKVGFFQLEPDKYSFLQYQTY